MGIFTGREQRAAPWTTAPPIPPFYGTDSAGRRGAAVDPREALSVSAVWSCTSLLAGALSVMPLEAFRTGADELPTKIAQPRVIKMPAAGTYQAEWMHQVMVSLCLRGNALGRVAATDGLGRPVQVELMNPDAVKIDTDDDTGAVRYTVRRTGKALPTEQVWHLRGMTMPGEKVGLSPVAYAARVVGIDLAAQDFAEDFLTGAGNPKGVLESDQPIDQERATTIKDRVLAATAGRAPLVLGAGLKFRPLSVKPEESQFLATQHAGIGDVARFFGIPPEMVGGPSGGGMQYSNREQRALDFLTFTVLPWMRRIEDSVSDWLPTGVSVAFNPAALLRVDVETQAKVDVQRLAGRIHTPTEVRARENLPPMTDEQKEEVGLVPLTITPLGGAKALPGIGMPGPLSDEPTTETDPQGVPSA